MYADNSRYAIRNRNIKERGNFMYCKKCGAALPSHGFICKRCGTLMDSDQIKEQKEYMKNEDNQKVEVNLISDKYRREPINRDYSKRKDNKLIL